MPPTPKRWSTTPQRAREVVRKFCERRRDFRATDEQLREIYGTNTTIVVVPSPFAARIIASMLQKIATEPPAGVWRPTSIAEAVSAFGITPLPRFDVPFSEQLYDVSDIEAFPISDYAIYYGSDYYAAYLDVAIDGGYKRDEPTTTYEEAAHVGALIHSEHLVIVIESPDEIKVFEPFGALVSIFRDGTKIASRGGILLPLNPVIRPHTMTAAEISAIDDEELKAHAIENYAGPGQSPSSGWIKFLEDIGATVLDERTNDIEGTHEALFETKNRCVLVATCPTRRLFALSTPPTCRTCAEAQAWLHRNKRIVART